MALSPNWLTKQIEVSSPQVVITAQDLINDIRDFEYSWDGMAYERIADASGKEDLGNGVSVGITVSLLSPWQILWYIGNYIATISGGNLVGGLGGDNREAQLHQEDSEILLIMQIFMMKWN
jgi:hypothetical protein